MENGTELHDFTARELSEWTGVHIKTARRWLKESHGISAGNRQMITYQAQGWIVPEDWRDFFKFVNGFAVIENTYTLSHADVRGYWLMVQYRTWYRAEAKKVKQAGEYIRYLETLLERATVTALPRERMRPTLTAGQEDNPYFQKVKEAGR